LKTVQARRQTRADAAQVIEISGLDPHKSNDIAFISATPKA
jgi:hypothetical protein